MKRITWLSLKQYFDEETYKTFFALAQHLGIALQPIHQTSLSEAEFADILGASNGLIVSNGSFADLLGRDNLASLLKAEIQNFSSRGSIIG